MRLWQEQFGRGRIPNDGWYECPTCGRASKSHDVRGVYTINAHTHRIIRTKVEQIRARCPVGHTWIESSDKGNTLLP